ncbi:hypothetical protein RU86_GL000624 [Lactococcus piscium]|uniref:Uncharacterized protein n=1 Tax=Pseudolactococcus piscium TaxID=1364 RepID=A0A2A5RWJ4_9LACT|nr:hypothetical protein [Lactococcus piscium]PCS05617.1 hypothetical protein RU86_GL000624 [Lactococcus piscium]
MIVVKKVSWLDEDSGEAEVLLSDDFYAIECFCSDCDLSEGERFTDIIYGFNIRNIVRSSNEDYAIESEKDTYHINGKLVDKGSKILQIGAFKIDISDGAIPKDIMVNEYVEVDIPRIDIY